MSYDLTLFRPPAGLDPIEAIHRIEREEADYIVFDDDLQRLADLLRARVAGFRQSMTGDGSIELDHDAQVQVIITDREIGITMPYFRPGVTDMMRIAAECVEGLADEGFVAFDPQLDKIVTLADFTAMTAQYRDTDKVLPHIVRDARSQRSTTKPWWKFW